MKTKNKIKHRDLVLLGSKWLMKVINWKYKCQYICPELVCNGGVEDPDILGLNPNGHILIEVKTNRNDFLRDKKKRGRMNHRKQIGSYRFYLVPENIITIDDLPDGWGLLVYDNQKINLIKEPDKFDENFKDVGYFYHSIIRRLFKPVLFNFREKEKIWERVKN